MAIFSVSVGAVAAADTSLNLTKGSSDVVGLDSNKPTTEGPNQDLIQIHIYNNGSTVATNVTSTLIWTTNSAYIDKNVNESYIKIIGSIQPYQTVDVFYLIDIDRNAPLDKNGVPQTTRSYQVSVSGNNTNTSIINGTFGVYGITSQNRNNVNSITASNTTPLTGDTFTVTVSSSTSSAGYLWVYLPVYGYNPKIIQPIGYTVTYNSLTSNNLYIDLPNANLFVGVWTFRVISPGNTTIGTLIDDKENGQSYHYNKDFNSAINIITMATQPKADVTLSQTVNTPVNVGDLVSFIVTATNQGPDTATNINISDIVPSLLGSPVVTTSVGTYNSTTGIWTIPSLAYLANATLNITGIATAAMAGITVNNTATHINQTEYDPTPNDTTTASVYTKKADVVLSQTGGYNKTTVTFVVTARNTGPDTATQVNIRDLIPAGLSGVTFTPSVGSYNSTSGLWTIPSLANGSSATLTIVGTAIAQSTVTNNATQASQVEYDPTVNSGLLSVYVPGADIIVTQYPWLYDNVINASVDQYLCANTPVFVVHVVNSNSSDDATGVVLEYLVGTGYDYINCNTLNVGTATYNSLTRIITWNVGFMPKGGEAFLMVYVKIVKTGNKTVALTNLARLKSLDQYEMNNANNESSYALIVPTSADIQVSQTMTNFTNSSGSYVTYTITVANNGPDNATGLTIADKLAAGLLYVSDNSGGSYNKTSGIWTIGNFSFGEAAKTLVITAMITGNGTIKNSAVRSSLVENDWNYANNGQTTIMVVSGTYNPTVDIRVLNYPWYYDAASQTSKEDYMYGTTPLFVMQVSNPNKYDDATGVVFEYVLGTGFEYLDCNTQGSGTATYDPLTHTITWNLGLLARGGTAFLKVYTKVISTGNKTPELTTIARLKSVDQTDVNTANNVANCSIVVASAADVQLKQVQEVYSVGGSEYIDYTITVTNNGPNTATGIVVINNLPAGVTYLSNAISYDGGMTWVANDTAYNASTSNGTWAIGNLSTNQSTILKITVKVTGTSTIKSTATKSTQANGDWNLNNNGQTVIYARP